MPARDELKLCGMATVRARFQRDAGSIQRLYFDQATGRKIGVMCKALAASRRVYRCVEPAELEKIAGSVHHGGIVAVVPAPVVKPPGAADIRRWASRRSTVLVLDRIGNAHNLGALVRTAAFFGVGQVVVSGDPAAAGPNEAAYRVAEGGFEHLEVWRAADLPKLLGELRAVGYDTVAAATRGGAAVKTSDAPLALVLGNEETGVGPKVAAACQRAVTVIGAGEMESLNVSVAGGILLHALLATGGKRRTAQAG
jgi:RNA methyltransferase, TrmH family